MTIRPLGTADIPRWTALRGELWPDQDPVQLASEGPAALVGDPPLIVFVADDVGDIVGFIELSRRSYGEGCDSSPVPYVEGWFVAPTHRGKGVGRMLMETVVRWCRAHGFRELASDSLVTNTAGRAAHLAVGFDEVETIVVFRREL